MPVEVRIPTTSIPFADPIVPQPMPRRAKLNPGDFARHGYTVGCPGCEQLKLGSSVRRNHTEDSRKIIVAELTKTSHGQERLGRAKERLDTRAAEIGKAIINNENKNIPEMPHENIEESINESNNGPEGAGEDDPMAQGTPNPSTPRAGPGTEHSDLSPRASSKRLVGGDGMVDDSPDKRLRPRSPFVSY